MQGALKAHDIFGDFHVNDVQVGLLCLLGYAHALRILR